ncbi:response regulator [archaeon]|nr:response regulator [archaeon]NCQ50430.1 response regulator [archaeon]
MSDIFAYIIPGVSVIGSIAIVLSIKSKYNKSLESILKESVNNNSSEKVKLLESNLSKTQNNLKELNQELLSLSYIAKEKTQEKEKAQAQAEDYLKDKNSLNVENNNLLSQIKSKNEQINNYENLLSQLTSDIEILKQEKTITPEIIQQKSILMVDDSIVIRTKMKKMLIEAGYDVTLANDGADAMELLPTKHFDLIITDLEMPNVDGFEFMKRANANEITKHIPIVIITGHDDVNLKINETENLTGIFKKPWKEVEFLKRIKFLSSLTT